MNSFIIGDEPRLRIPLLEHAWSEQLLPYLFSYLDPVLNVHVAIRGGFSFIMYLNLGGIRDSFIEVPLEIWVMVIRVLSCPSHNT